MTPRPTLRPVHSKLSSPGGPTRCINQFIARTPLDNKMYNYRVLVTESATAENLLSRGKAVIMGLIKQLDEVLPIQDVQDSSVGLLDCKPVKITLKQDVVLYSVSTPRHVPLRLLPKVEAELCRMEKLGIIQRVEGATDWSTPIVLVNKKNSDQVRICIDLRRLNQSVIHEENTTPVLDDILHKLAGSTHVQQTRCSQQTLANTARLGQQ